MENEFPHIQCYLLTSVKNYFMDFHIDMNGSTVWYNVAISEKNLCLVAPTDSNIKDYIEWYPNQKESFLSLIQDKKNH